MSQSASFYTNPALSRIPPRAVAIGLDIGGTKISAARVCLEQGMSGFQKIATPERGQEFVAAIETLVRSLRDSGDRDSHVSGYRFGWNH